MSGRQLRPFQQMHAARVWIARAPDLLRREHQHRRGVSDQRVEQRVEHGSVGAAPVPSGRIAVQPVLADIEVERRQVIVAEIDQRADVGIEVVALDCLPQRAIELGSPREHVPVERRQFAHRQ